MAKVWPPSHYCPQCLSKTSLQVVETRGTLLHFTRSFLKGMEGCYGIVEMSDTKLSEIDVAEVHDAFTILEILGYEDLGFAKKGEGGKFVNQEQIVINPRGGIIGCGHPVGATGVAQVAEIASQLAGKAGNRQVRNCKTGLVHNLAAAGSSASVIVMGV